MNERPTDILGELQRRRSGIVQGFLWTLLGIVALTVLLNVVLLGPTAFTLRALAPNTGFAALIGVALWLNHRHRFRAALGIVIGVTLAAASLPLLLGGLDGNEIALLVFFIPVVLAGLLLDRAALGLAGGWSLLVVLSAPALRDAGLLLGEPRGTDAGWAPALQFGVVFGAVLLFLERFGSVLHRALDGVVERDAALQREAAERRRTDEALLEEKRFNDAIIDNLPGLFYVIDESGSYFQWNRNFERVLGYDEDEIARLDPLDLFEGEARPRIARRIADVFEHGSATAEASLITKAGERIPYFLNGTKVAMRGGTYLAGIGIDRSEIDAARARIERLDEELRERLERITALHEIDKAIIGDPNLDGTLEVVLEQVTRRLQVDAACILLYRPQERRLRFGASKGFRSDALRDVDLRLGQGLAGRAAEGRERVFVSDPADFARAFRAAREVAGEDFRSYAAVPLIAKGRLQGVLELFHRSPLAPSDDWQAFLTTLATQAAIALHNATLFEDLERSNAELRQAYDTTIEGWARALDLRDEETEGHSRRVTGMTMRLAERMGVDEEELVHVRRGALLHDIGKMGVPDHILLKPGKLTEEEWDVMKRHTVYAYDFLAPIPFLRPALDIPYCHHERWDGSGYPRGLRGERIPLAARIFSVVDVYDALRSDRPYRAAWSEERTLAYLREQSGVQFDPRAVDAFLELVRSACGSGLP